MGSESSLWKTLNNNMGKRGKDYWEPCRVENPAEPGTPDVYVTIKDVGRFSMNWIELKHTHSWPKRSTTVLKIDHFTPQQKGWIRRHTRAGARVWLIIQVARDYFLFQGLDCLLVGELTKEGYYKKCYRSWKNRIDYLELKECLSNGI